MRKVLLILLLMPAAAAGQDGGWSINKVDIELIGIIFTLVAGFGGLFWRMGSWMQKTEELKKDVEGVTAALVTHENKCDEREAEVNGRFSEGGKEIAVLQAGQERIERDMGEIKTDIKSLLKGDR